MHRRPLRSILCMPLVTQANLVGVLYLENNLTPGVFGPGRTGAVKVLATHAAIALENTRLYRDLAEREAKVRHLHAELTHANRIAAMGQLTASIAHEVKQPIGAAVTNAQAALRWLGRQSPDLKEVRGALDRIVDNALRANDVIDRIRTLVKKAPPRNERFDINDAIGAVIELTRAEAARSDVLVETALADSLPMIEGDRVQLQQVILNLIMNGIEAMSDVNDGARELLISTLEDATHGVLVQVRDSGPGLAPDTIEHLFNAFYTTKPDGLGLGLSICRSIIEAHGGRMWATANVPQGVVFEFTVPIHPKIAS